MSAPNKQREMKKKGKRLIGELLIDENSQGYADRERIEDRRE